MSAGRRSVLVTFKPKEQRPDRTMDKLDIIRGAVTQGVQPYFVDATTLAMGASQRPVPLNYSATT